MWEKPEEKRVRGRVKMILSHSPSSWYITAGPIAAVPIPSAIVKDDEGREHIFAGSQDLHEGDLVNVVYVRCTILWIKCLSYWGVVGYEKIAA